MIHLDEEKIMTEENLKRIYGAYTLTEDEMNFILEDNQSPAAFSTLTPFATAQNSARPAPSS